MIFVFNTWKNLATTFFNIRKLWSDISSVQQKLMYGVETTYIFRIVHFLGLESSMQSSRGVDFAHVSK